MAALRTAAKKVSRILGDRIAAKVNGTELELINKATVQQRLNKSCDNLRIASRGRPNDYRPQGDDGLDE